LWCIFSMPVFEDCCTLFHEFEVTYMAWSCTPVNSRQEIYLLRTKISRLKKLQEGSKVKASQLDVFHAWKPCLKLTNFACALVLVSYSLKNFFY
jgi:hypothetical protein